MTQLFLQRGILYHQHGPAKQLVVPKDPYTQYLDHSVPWAGHLKKTEDTALH